MAPSYQYRDFAADGAEKRETLNSNISELQTQSLMDLTIRSKSLSWNEEVAYPMLSGPHSTLYIPPYPGLISHGSIDFPLESSSSSFPLSPKSPHQLLTTLNWCLNEGAQLPYPLRGHFLTLGFLNDWDFLWSLYYGLRYSSGENLLHSSFRLFHHLAHSPSFFRTQLSFS